MSDHGNHSPAVACPVCLERKSTSQHDMVCGACVLRESELTRNSVIENEALNRSMREQIDAIFDACYRQSVGDDAVDVPSGVGGESRPNHQVDSVRPLALNLQKLEAMNRQMKRQGLQKSCDLLSKKNQALEQKIETLSSRLKTNELQIHLKEKKMLEDYSRRLEALDREIISVQYERLRRTSRQAALEQYSSYKIIREHYFSFSRSSETSNSLQLCERPVLQLEALSSTQLVTVNTFLEDLIKLVLLLHRLSSVRSNGFDLPYLEYLKGLLPEQNFYESVQTKIDSILHRNQSAPGSSDEGVAFNENTMETLSENAPIFPIEADKITIVDRKIRVPRSFRTMNSRRRSSVLESDSTNKGSSPEATSRSTQAWDRPNRETARQYNAFSESVSPKTSIKTQATEHGTSWISQPESHSEADRIHGKRIVIIPHRILSKPFSKLSANDYLRFLSIVVKILVVYNTFLQHALGSSLAATTEKRGRGFHLFSQNSDPEPSSTSTQKHKPKFIYDIKELLSKIAHLDTFFQDESRREAHEAPGAAMAAQVSHSMEDSRATIAGKDTSLGSSVAGSRNLPAPPVAQNPWSLFSGLYAMFGANKRAAESRRASASVADNAIYGMVSETMPHSAAKNNQQGDKKKEKKPGKEGSHSQPHEHTARGAQTDLKHISRVVHGMILGNGGTAHLDRVGANSIMQQSTSQLDDWDVVSKMF